MIHGGALADRSGSVLERLARRGPPRPAGERCELCAEGIADAHGHVVDVRSRRLLCVCRPCHLLFTPDGAGGGQFAAVPDRSLALGVDAIGPQQWDRLEVPVSVAFFFHNSVLGHVVGLYPGPGGATESQLAFDAWHDLQRSAPALASMAPDVEALLVRRDDAGIIHAFVVPVDLCYELTGRLRSVWQGIDGGREAHRTLDDFFRWLADRSATAGPER